MRERQTDKDLISHSLVQVQLGPHAQGMGSMLHTAGPYCGWPATGGITPRAEDLRFLQLYKIHSLTEMENPIFAYCG